MVDKHVGLLERSKVSSVRSLLDPLEVASSLSVPFCRAVDLARVEREGKVGQVVLAVGQEGGEVRVERVGEEGGAD